jgi:hypothetical protein
VYGKSYVFFMNSLLQLKSLLVIDAVTLLRYPSLVKHIVTIIASYNSSIFGSKSKRSRVFKSTQTTKFNAARFLEKP